MHRINKDVKRRSLPAHVREHLDYISHFQVKAQIGGFTFLLLDLFILLPLLNPPNQLFLWTIGPLLAGVSLWAVSLLMRRVEETELESILFLGCLGGAGSLSYLLITVKYCLVLGVTSPGYYAFLVLTYLVIMVLFIKHYRSKFSSLDDRPIKPVSKWQYAVVGIVIPLGNVLANIVLGFSESVMLSVLTMIFFGFSITYMFLLTKFLHKYLFIKTNYSFATFSKKESVKEF
ncbi:hypothetical protein [Metabacillus indicus]|uniref:hypothetical protein n=1 Tax=Metabacillus indicus TaxID=246786 RepID=UPI003CEE89DF